MVQFVRVWQINKRCDLQGEMRLTFHIHVQMEGHGVAGKGRSCLKGVHITGL